MRLQEMNPLLTNRASLFWSRPFGVREEDAKGGSDVQFIILFEHVYAAALNPFDFLEDHVKKVV